MNLVHGLGDNASSIHLAASTCDIKSPEFANCREIIEMVGYMHCKNLQISFRCHFVLQYAHANTELMRMHTMKLLLQMLQDEGHSRSVSSVMIHGSACILEWQI